MKKFSLMILPIVTCVLSCISADTKINSPLQNYTLTTAVPKAYFSTAAKKGTMQLIEYATRDYTQSSRPPITKKAYVYPTYGYNVNDAVYAMARSFICMAGLV